jgi:phage terminase small subunit
MVLALTAPTTVETREMGPAMRALTEKQRRFVEALCSGESNHARAAAVAGYEGGPEFHKVNGYRLAHNPAVVAAIREEAEQRVNAGSALAMSKLIEIARADGHKDQFKAVIRLLDQSGMVVVTKSEVTIHGPKDEKEQIARIRVLAEALGMDKTATNKLIGTSRVTDAEFEVIEADPMAQFALEE